MTSLPRLAALAVTASLLAGCMADAEATADGGTQEGDAPAEITVTGPASPPSMAFLRMVDTDALDDTAIIFERWETADQLSAAVTSGSDVVAAPLTTGASLYQKGAGLQLLNVSAWDVMGLVTNDSAVRSIEDLAGTQLHVAMRASAVDYTTQLVLEAHDLTDSVEIVYVDPLNGPEQFMAGQISSLATVEPQVTMLLGQADGARSIVDFTEEWEGITGADVPLPTAGTFVSAEFAEEHPETAIEFHEAYAEAAAWVADNPGDAAALAEEHLGIPAGVVSAAIPTISWDAQRAEEAQPAVDLYFEELFARWPDSIGGAMPDAGFYVR
jgi:NitT/TauT family transport system substrate-binding protein